MPDDLPWEKCIASIHIYDLGKGNISINGGMFPHVELSPKARKAMNLLISKIDEVVSILNGDIT